MPQTRFSENIFSATKTDIYNSTHATDFWRNTVWNGQRVTCYAPNEKPNKHKRLACVPNYAHANQTTHQTNGTNGTIYARQEMCQPTKERGFPRKYFSPCNSRASRRGKFRGSWKYFRTGPWNPRRPASASRDVERLVNSTCWSYDHSIHQSNKH